MFDFIRKRKDRTELARILRTESAADRLKQKYDLVDLPMDITRTQANDKRRARPMSLQLSESTTDSESSYIAGSKQNNAKRRFTIMTGRSSLSLQSQGDEKSSTAIPGSRMRNRRARTISVSTTPNQRFDRSGADSLAMSSTFRQNTNESNMSAASSNAALSEALADITLPADSLNCVVSHTPVIVNPTTSHADHCFTTEIVHPTALVTPDTVDADAPPMYQEVEKGRPNITSGRTICKGVPIIDGAKDSITSMTSQNFQPVEFLQVKLAARSMSPLSTSQKTWKMS